MGNSDRRKFIDAFLRMDTTIWLSVALAVITFATPALTSEPRVVCYYTNWSVYRPGTAKFNPQNINPYLCTHLIYAFGGFTKDNTLKPFDKYQDIEKGGYAKFTGLKTYNKNLKTMLAIGGWNEGSTRFSPMVASKERRKEFVRNAIKFLRQNRFDGLDLDWEYPAFRDGGKPKDRENYARLVRELREEFNREAEKTGRPRLLLTMAVPAGIEYIQKGFDVKTLNRYLDWMNLLTYDYHSAFEPAVNHHAPLYPLEEPNEYSVDSELNIDYTIKFYLENGADRDKLVLGIPTYGRSYTLFNADAVEIGAPADGPGEQGDATREKGYLAYYEICESLKPKTNKKRSASDEESEEVSEEEEDEDLPWSIMHPNPSAMGPVAYRGNQWVGYDDTEIVKKKAEYVAENGLGGIMFWSIDNDDFRGTCHGKPYPLIEAAKEAYIVKLGSTDNAIVTDKPRSVTTSRSSNRRRNRPRVTTTTEKPSTVTKASKRKSSSSVSSTTPSWNITPEPPTTPDPGSDFKCKDEGFFQHPRDCKKYFWCLDSGPSNLGIVAHQFTCPSGLFFNKAADSCDFARNVLCKIPSATTKAPTTKATTSTTSTTTTTRRPVKLSTKSSSQFRTTSSTTPEPESEEEYEYEEEDAADIDAEDPRVIKELIDLIKKVGGVEQLEKHLHLAETSLSTDVAVSTTPSSFNKRLYQKVLERTRGRTKLTGNSLTDALSQNSRGGPQNAGLEPTSDKDKLQRRDRPQYTTINRARPSKTKEPLEEESVEDEVEEAPQQLTRARAVESQAKVATTAKPLQYVNIRRARPTVATSDTADDTASRNALFERSETYVTVSDSPNSLDIAIPPRDNIPEYVTIRRQRPTTEEATTVQYKNTEPEEESQETALEREISSPASQPQYTSIIRTRSTTTPTPDEITPEPTTVLAVQISSLLNSPSSSEVEERETTVEAETTTISTTSRPTTTTTTTTTTPAPPATPTRRQLIRRRSTTTTSTTTSAPASSTQVSSRNYTFVRRRRPLSQPNEISDSDDIELTRSIRSTTPDSTEVDGKVRETGLSRRFRSRFQTQTKDSVSDQIPDAASPVSRGQYRAQLTRDEVLSLTPVDVDEEIPQFVQRPSFSQRSERQFRGRTSTTVAEPIRVEDSEVSAAEVRRPNIVPRGRGRFTPSSTTKDLEQSVATESTPSQRRPTFSRFTPRPFARATSASTTTEGDDEKDNEPVVTQRIPSRLPFGRFRPSSTTAVTSAPPALARKLPFSSRFATTQQTLANEPDEDEPEENNDEISLSESAIEEKEHEENIDEGESEEPQKRRVVIKKLKVSSSSPADNTSPTEAVPITDDNGKRRFRVIRRRPTSTTESLETSSVLTEAPSSTPPRIRKIIRKKLRPAENEPTIIAKSIGSLNFVLKDTTTEVVFNYGEKSRQTQSTITEAPTTTATVQKSEPITESEETKEETEQTVEKEQKKTDDSKTEEQKETDISETKEEEDNQSEKINSKDSESDSKPEVAVEAVQKAIDFSENIDESTSNEPTSVETTPTETAVSESDEPQTETTTPSTTQQTSPSSRNRLPYRPPKRKLFTSTTEATPSSSRTYSRRYNPGAYTSPSTVDRVSEPNIRQPVTRRPLFSSRTFTRRPFTTARTTKKVEEDEEEYSDEEILDEEPENEQVLVPKSQLFTRRPNLDNEDEEEENYNSKEEEDEESEEEQSVNRFPSSRKPIFKPRVVNSNTFRTTTSTTEIPKRLSSQNRTSIYSKFGGNKSVNDTKTRVQNVPIGYSSPSAAKSTVATNEKKETVADKDSDEGITSTNASTDETETTTEDDDYLSMTEPGTTLTDNTNASEDSSSTNSFESETATAEMEIDDSTDDYLEYTEGTTNYPTTQYSSTNTQTETETTSDDRITTANTEASVKVTTTTTTETVPETTITTTTTTSTTQAPIIKTQYNKLFSVSRVVEVNSKLDKHRVNKNNETTLIEEGKIMVETKPRVDEIGEVSRFSLIKIYEDEIPIYLTKLGHVYPVENPPDNLIRIDEARNARALVNFADAPRENLIASESMNEAYRHIVNSVTSQPKDDTASKSQIQHIQNDGFLSYVNDDKRVDKIEETQSYPSWNFVPAAYENEKNKAARSFEIITPRSMLTEPSTLPLEALFKTENPVMARKVGGDGVKQPFVVYSASVPTQKEDANIVKLEVLKPETGRSIITFAKGQEFHGPPVNAETTVKYPINISVLPQTSETTISTTTTTTPKPTSMNTSPVIQLLTTSAPTTLTTEQQTTVVTTTEASTTETIPEETTTVKSLFDAKRKFAFPRRPVIKPVNITRAAPRTVKKINSTVSSNSFQKPNKTSSFSPNKNRYSANRAQNVPVDIRKKANSPKLSPKTFTTEAPRSTTERKLYFKPIRPNLRPSFVPRRNTTPSPQVTGDT